MHDARVLPRAYMGLTVDSAGEDVRASICRSHIQPLLQRGARLFGDLKLNRTAGLVLDNRRPVSHAAARIYVIDPEPDEIAAAKLAINGEVEHRQIAFAFAALHLKADTDGPDLLRPKGRFWPTTRPLFHAAREAGSLSAHAPSSSPSLAAASRARAFPLPPATTRLPLPRPYVRMPGQPRIVGIHGPSSPRLQSNNVKPDRI